MTGAAKSLARSLSATVLQVIARMVVILVVLIVLFAITDFVQSRMARQPVTRIALAEVPVEKVVEFGHEEGAFSFVPSPADPAAPVAGDGPAVPVATARNDIAPAAKPAIQVRPDANGVLPIGFSLERGETSAGGGVGVSKTIASPKGEMAGLTIFIVGDALIEVDRAELVRALSTIGATEEVQRLPQASGNGRISLDRLRQAGLDVRYDAVGDRLVLHP